MDTFNKVMGVCFTILISIIVFFIGVKKKVEGNPNSLYKVYLNGNTIGLIESKQDLLDLIDREQTEIKERYSVDKVYPPSGLDIEDVVTYDTDISDVTDIYNKIKNEEPFTISGYTITINYKEEKNEETEKVTKHDPVSINVLKKDDFMDFIIQ